MIPLSGETLYPTSPHADSTIWYTQSHLVIMLGGLYLIIRLPLGSFRAFLGSSVLRVWQLQPHSKEIKIFQLYIGKCPFIRRIIPSVARGIFLLAPITFLRYIGRNPFRQEGRDFSLPGTYTVPTWECARQKCTSSDKISLAKLVTPSLYCTPDILHCL